MIQVSNQYNTIISNGGHYEWRIVNGSIENGVVTGVVIGDSLISGTLKNTLFETVSIGNVISKQLDIQFYKDVTIDTTEPLIPQFRAVSDSDQSDWYGATEFWIDTFETSKYTDKASITAFDSLLKANVTYLKTGTWTATTDLAIVQSIATEIGVTVNSDTLAMFSTTQTISVAPSIGEGGTTDMQMLSYIAVLKGGNFIINADNELELIFLNDLNNPRDIATIGKAVTDFEAGDPETINGVCIWYSSNAFYRFPQVSDSEWESLGGRKINANCFIATLDQAAVTSAMLYNAFHFSSTYQPYTAPTVWIDPKYQLGDKITVTDSLDNTVTSVICNQTIKLDALSVSSLSAEGQKQVNSSYPYLTPTQREIEQKDIQTRASIQVLDDAIQSTVETIDGMQTQITQNAEGIEVITQRNEEQDSYLRWNGATATLSIGESNSPTEAQIDPSGFSVVQDGEAIFEAKGRKAQARHLVGTETVTVGRWQWADEGTDGFSLFYIGS